jgi:hypothetical protein
MIGERIGSGVNGIIVGALQSKDNPRRYAAIIEEEPGRYIVGYVRLGFDGTLSDEWDAGRYGLSFEDAVRDAADRVLAGQP